FSSRRRHTRWPRDWSSDVCSSDLLLRLVVQAGLPIRLRDVEEQRRQRTDAVDEDVLLGGLLELAEIVVHLRLRRVLARLLEVGRSEERRVGKECRSRRWAQH